MKAQIPSSHIVALASDMGRRSFWAYCCLMMPSIYNKRHLYLKNLCESLQLFIKDQLLDGQGNAYQKLMICMPPRHAKSLTVILFCQWLLGIDREQSIITTSYNEGLSVRMAKAVRDGIQAIKTKPNSVVYSDFFPGTKIKKGDSAMHLWSLEDRHFSYLATSPGGTLTGIGGKLIICDDIIKNWYEANNERILEEHLDWYNNTLMSRKEHGAKQIIIMTRWSNKDLAGQLLEREPGEWYIFKLPAQLPDGTMLAPDILSLEEFDRRKATNDPQLIAANYQQEPYESRDRLYSQINTYLPELLPREGQVCAVVDSADLGSDFLAGFVYRVHKNTAYIIDAIYTQDGMEITEGQTALMLANNRVQEAHIESNNGGRNFARNVERIMRENLKYSACRIKWFHQTENKVARILSNATNVCNSVLFPSDWEQRWPILAQTIKRAGKAEKWTHDDAFDALTMIVEKSILKQGISVPSVDLRGKLGL